MTTEHIQTVKHGTNLTIRDVEINGKRYELAISEFYGNLFLNFSERGEEVSFSISCVDGKLRFSRRCLRQNHDHDDVQSLIYNPQAEPEMQLYWSNRLPTGDGRRLEIDFGKVTVDF